MPTPRRTRFLCAALCGVLALPGLAQAAIKCWTNSEGGRECGSVVPPEYAQERLEIRNERGMVVNVEEGAKSPAQLEEEARRAREQEERKQRAETQAREDRILLDTFMSEQDIVRSRDDKLTALEGGIQLTESMLERQQANLERLHKRAAPHEKRGEPLPEDIAADIAELERQIDNNHRYIEDQRAEQAKIRDTYEAYLERFRQLTAGR